MKTALTIAGSDSGGGAGIQADLKAFAANGVYGMSVITAVTAQNTREVRSVQNLNPTIIADQIKAVFDDIVVDAIKVGMLSSQEIVRAVAQSLQLYSPSQLVLDPVMVSKGGHPLLQGDAIEALKREMIPLANIVTPNIPEAEVLTGMRINNKEDMQRACVKIKKLGCETVLLKGGHFNGPPNDLFYDGEEFQWFLGERIVTKNTHGTGCTLSSTIAANLAKGASMPEAIKQAKIYINVAILHSLSLGYGHGPLHHFYELYQKANRKESFDAN